MKYIVKICNALEHIINGIDTFMRHLIRLGSYYIAIVQVILMLGVLAYFRIFPMTLFISKDDVGLFRNEVRELIVSQDTEQIIETGITLSYVAFVLALVIFTVKILKDMGDSKHNFIVKGFKEETKEEVNLRLECVPVYYLDPPRSAKLKLKEAKLNIRQNS